MLTIKLDIDLFDHPWTTTLVGSGQVMLMTPGGTEIVILTERLGTIAKKFLNKFVKDKSPGDHTINVTI